MIEHHGYVINGYVVGRDGYSLHLVDLDGRAVRSYGHGHDDPWGTVGSVRLVTRATEAGHFWAARHDRYEVDLWSAGGELVRTLRRTPGWWTIIQETELPAEEETGILVQTSSRVVGVQVDRRDRLIVISRTPTVGQNVVQVPTFADVSDVVVEALHPTTGRVLGVCRFADGLGGPAGHDHLFTFRELRPGRGKVIVWEVS